MGVWLDRWMAMAGWMASSKTSLTCDQTQAQLDSRTTTHTHDQKHMGRLMHDQTHAQPDSRKTRLTQDQTHARHVCNNYSNKFYLSKSIAVIIN